MLRFSQRAASAVAFAVASLRHGARSPDRSAAILERRPGEERRSPTSSRASRRRAARTSCRPPSASPPSTTTARCGPSSRSISRSRSRFDRVKALAPQHPEWKTQQPFKAVLDRRHEGAGRGRREGPARDHRGDAHRHDDRGVRQDRAATGSRPRGIRASTGPTPSWSTSRCWSCWPICAPTASRPSSSPAAASSSCGLGREGLRHPARAGGRLVAACVKFQIGATASRC